MTGLQVEHTDEKRHKHIGMVVLAHRIVHLTHDLRRTVNLHGDGMEQHFRHRHKQGSRHALARHIADAEEQMLIADMVVEQIAAHRLRGCHMTVNIDIMTFREWRVLTGNHRHLNVVGNLQLIINGRLLGSGLLQILHILSERMLHRSKGVAQPTEFILVCNHGQRRVEVTFCHLISRLGQRTEGL